MDVEKFVSETFQKQHLLTASEYTVIEIVNAAIAQDRKGIEGPIPEPEPRDEGTIKVKLNYAGRAKPPPFVDDYPDLSAMLERLADPETGWGRLCLEKDNQGWRCAESLAEVIMIGHEPSPLAAARAALEEVEGGGA